MAAIMSLKQEIETWVEALARYDNNEFDDALSEFDSIADTSKILFNIGVIHATLGEHEKAVECYQRATRLDQYLAVAYFQQGVSNFLIGDFEEALANFNDTLLYLRGNTMIDYAQLGLLFKLYSCEVLFNRGLCYIYLQQTEPGMQDLLFAVKEKVVEDHDVIDDAIQEEAEGYTVFSIPVGVVYRPNEAKVRNLKTKDYLGKARLVATSDRPQIYSSQSGPDQRYVQGARVEINTAHHSPDSIPFPVSHLVKPGLQSRRQQSEPPANRNVFPPTPPPENERPTRNGSVRSGQKPALAKLNIQPQESNRKYEKAASPPDARPRLAARSASSTTTRGLQREPPTLQPIITGPIEEENVGHHVERENGSAAAGGSHNSHISHGSRGSRGSRRPSNSRPTTRLTPGDGSEYGDAFVDEADFVMMNGYPNYGPISATSGSSSRGTMHHHQQSRPDVRKIRVKVHGEDMRYIIVNPTIEFPEFEERVRDKLNLRRRFKIKVRDEDMPNGDMITLGDQDDLEMVVSSSVSDALRERQEVAKLEIWVFAA